MTMEHTEHHSVTCPHCQATFSLDRADYIALAEQVRGLEFDREVRRVTEDLTRQFEQSQDLAVQKALADAKEAENALRNRLSVVEAQCNVRLREKEVEHREKLAKVEAERDMYKAFKTSKSTKAVGEDLETFCYEEFEKFRGYAFPGDYFEKDNVLSDSGSKGDFIYRAFTSDGLELVSAMLEMKTELEETKRPHKNSDFFAELDKDRKEKHCEYAVLVTMLEPKSPIYNQGIVLAPHPYEKMFIIRPEFLIPMLALLRNFGLQLADVRLAAEEAKAADRDLTAFSSELADVIHRMDDGFDNLDKRHDKALAGIETAIKRLESIRSELLMARKISTALRSDCDCISIAELCGNNHKVMERLGADGASDDSGEGEADL